MNRCIRICLLVSLVLAACLPAARTPVASSQDAPATPVPPTASPTQEPSEPTPTPVPPTKTIPASPTPAQPQSVIVLSMDALRADVVADLAAEGRMPNFSALAARGVWAEYARSVDPPLTAAAHSSMAAGASPGLTGIVSNAYHNPSDSFYWYRRGFEEPLEGGEPVWVTASKAGLKTATVFFTGGSPERPGQSADYTVGYGIQDGYSRQVKVALQPLQSAWGGEIPASFSPPREGSFTVPRVARVYLLALDRSDDGQAGVDTVILSTARQVEPGSPGLRVGQWGPLVLLPAEWSGADFLIQELTGAGVTLFHTGVHHNTAAPRSLLERLNREFGFFPSGPDAYAFEHGWITAEDQLILLKRASHWMAEVTAWIHSTYHPDLLFAWQDGLDGAGHTFFLQDPRQPNYSPERAEQYADYYRQAAGLADTALGRLLEGVDLQETAFFLVSDHGMAPVHTVVYVNTLLEQAGLLVLDGRDYVVVNRSKAFAVASGGAVHVYINRQGHEKNGIVFAEEYPEVQAQVVALLESLADPQTGEAVFERVLPQGSLGPLGLDHPNAGDVFAQANLGYSLDGWRGMAEVFKPAPFYGQHGYSSERPEMRAVFLAAGAGVPAWGETIPRVEIIDYAPTIAALLGFEPAPSVEGDPIPALLPGRR